MSRPQRLQRLEDAALEAWLREEAARLDLPMEEAWRQNRLWDGLLLKYGVREGDPLPLETIEAFLREFALAAAPEDEPTPYVNETLALWERSWQQEWMQAEGKVGAVTVEAALDRSAPGPSARESAVLGDGTRR